MSSIRKISVGTDFPDGCIHYQVGGKPINLNGVPHDIVRIAHDKNLKKKFGINEFEVFISRVGYSESILWKTITNMPVIAEDNIDFE